MLASLARSFLFSLSLGIAAGLSIGCHGTDGEPRLVLGHHPVILLDIDTLAASHLGCYGYERATSPALDRFAQDAVRFEWAFSQAPYTPPSQTSILTALHPRVHGVHSVREQLAEEITTLAEVFQTAGYTTAAFTDGGFMSRSFGLAQGFELFDDSGGGLDVLAPKVSSWIDAHREQSFLLLVHTYAVHTPYQPPEPYRSIFLDGLASRTPGFEPTSEAMETVRRSMWTDRPQPLPAADLAYAEALYDAEIRQLDAWLEALFSQLEDAGLLDRATVVVFSDHGEAFGEHGSVLHELLYSPVTRIPLILRLPRGRQARTVDATVGAIDLMPTLLDLAGLEPPPAIQGRSLVPLLLGRSLHDRPIFSESPYFIDKPAVAWGDRRLIVNVRTAASELYAFRSDPLEQHDLAATEPAAAARLRRTLDGWQAAMANLKRALPEGAQVDDETLEQLRTLGYVR